MKRRQRREIFPICFPNESISSRFRIGRAWRKSSDSKGKKFKELSTNIISSRERERLVRAISRAFLQRCWRFGTLGECTGRRNQTRYWRTDRDVRPGNLGVFSWEECSGITASCKVMYVESVSRTKRMSLSGRLCYGLRLADVVFVMWPELKETYPRSRYCGRIY